MPSSKDEDNKKAMRAVAQTALELFGPMATEALKDKAKAETDPNTKKVYDTMAAFSDYLAKHPKESVEFAEAMYDMTKTLTQKKGGKP